MKKEKQTIRSTVRTMLLKHRGDVDARVEKRLVEHFESMANIYITKDYFEKKLDDLSTKLSEQITELREIVLQLVNKDQNEYAVMGMHVQELQETTKKHDARIGMLEKHSD